MKKAEIKQVPISKADLLDERWIKTPFAYSSFGADFTLLQQHVMLEISSALQEEFNAYYRDGDISKLKERLKQEIKIPFRNLGITPNNYPTYFSAAGDETPTFISQMLKLSVQYIDGDNIKVAPMFGSFSVPDKVGEYRVKTSSDGTEVIVPGTENFLSAYINPYAIKAAFDMSKGYVKHLRLIAECAKRKGTPRVYLLLLRYRGTTKRNKFQIPYSDVREYMGVQKTSLLDGSVTVRYEKYSEFKREILEPARADLLRLSLCNQAEFTFEYTPVYPRGRKIGNPLLLEFVLTTSKLGEAVSATSERKNKETAILDFICSHQKGLKRVPLRRIVKSVPEERFVQFSMFCYNSLFPAVAKANPSNVEAYINKVLEQQARGGKAEKAQQLSLSFSSDKPMNPIKQWALCQKKMCDFVGDEVARRTFAELTFESYDEKTRKLLLQTTKAAFDEIEGHYTERFKACLTKCFGLLPIVSYRLKPAQQ